MEEVLGVRSITFRRPNKLDEMSFEDAERHLVMSLDRQQNVFRELLYQMVRLHIRVGDHQNAEAWTHRIRQMTNDVELAARCFAGIGCMMRIREEWGTAVDYLRRALGMEPKDPELWYYIHANLGFCLAKSGELSEGEKHCRLAITALPDYPTAYYYLGVTLQAQGKVYEAAETFLKAFETNGAEVSVLRNLEALVAANPDLKEQYEETLELLRAAYGMNDILRIHYEWEYAPGFRAKMRRTRMRIRHLMARVAQPR
jgi:tetratricopeptide (TPR) repeat protein